MEVKSTCDAEKRRLVLMNIVRFDQELFQIDYINFSTGSIKTKGRKPGKKAYSNSVSVRSNNKNVEQGYIQKNTACRHRQFCH